MDTNTNSDPKPESIGRFFKSARFWKTIIGIVIGATGGFLYFYFIGCKSGSCPITGNPYGSIAAGGFFGFLITGLFDKK
jgi:hypothetical protein